MQHIEDAIFALQNLTPDQHEILRTSVGYCIEGRADYTPDVGPGWIDPYDYAVIRRMAIEEAYKRRVAGQVWVAGKDKAFHESQGKVRAKSVILKHKFLI